MKLTEGCSVLTQLRRLFRDLKIFCFYKVQCREYESPFYKYFHYYLLKRFPSKYTGSVCYARVEHGHPLFSECFSIGEIQACPENKGFGSYLLRCVVKDLHRRANLPIVLAAVPLSPRFTEEELTQWYISHGFVELGHFLVHFASGTRR